MSKNIKTFHIIPYAVDNKSDVRLCACCLIVKSLKKKKKSDYTTLFVILLRE